MATNVRNTALMGMTWTGIDQCSGTIIRFVIGIVLARLLSPSDYGIVGMLAIFLALSNVFIDSGFANALIQKKRRNEEDYSTVFWFNICVSVVLFMVFYVVSPLIARFYDTPILKDVARVSALTMVVGSFTSVQTTRFRIDLRFKELAIISVLSSIVVGGVGVALAYCGFGVWSLVYASLSGAITRTALIWAVGRWLPKMVFSADSFHSLFSFGSKLFGAGIINAIYQNIYSLVIGKSFAAIELGMYNRANGYAQLPSQIVTSTVINVNFPILSNYQEDNQKLLQIYRQIIQVPVFVMFPIVLGMVAVARPLIAVMIGDKWLPCVPLLQVLCVGYLFAPLSDFNLILLNVKGRSDLVLKLEIIKKSVAFAIVGASIPFGVFGMCVGRALYILVSCIFNCYYTKRILNYGLFSQIKDISLIILNCLIMVCMVSIFLEFTTINSFLQLMLAIIIGVFSFTLFAILIKDQTFLSFRRMLTQRDL